MRLEVYNEKEKDEKPITLKLNEDVSNGEVDLFVVDENGDRLPLGSILSFKTTGRLKIYAELGSSFGFERDDLGKIKVKE